MPKISDRMTHLFWTPSYQDFQVNVCNNCGVSYWGALVAKVPAPYAQTTSFLSCAGNTPHFPKSALCSQTTRAVWLLFSSGWFTPSFAHLAFGQALSLPPSRPPQSKSCMLSKLNCNLAILFSWGFSISICFHFPLIPTPSPKIVSTRSLSVTTFFFRLDILLLFFFINMVTHPNMTAFEGNFKKFLRAYPAFFFL